MHLAREGLGSIGRFAKAGVCSNITCARAATPTAGNTSERAAGTTQDKIARLHKQRSALHRINVPKTRKLEFENTEIAGDLTPSLQLRRTALTASATPPKTDARMLPQLKWTTLFVVSCEHLILIQAPS